MSLCSASLTCCSLSASFAFTSCSVWSGLVEEHVLPAFCKVSLEVVALPCHGCFAGDELVDVLLHAQIVSVHPSVVVAECADLVPGVLALDSGCSPADHPFPSLVDPDGQVVECHALVLCPVLRSGCLHCYLNAYPPLESEVFLYLCDFLRHLVVAAVAFLSVCHCRSSYLIVTCAFCTSVMMSSSQVMALIGSSVFWRFLVSNLNSISYWVPGSPSKNIDQYPSP